MFIYCCMRYMYYNYICVTHERLLKVHTALATARSTPKGMDVTATTVAELFLSLRRESAHLERDGRVR